MMLYGNDMDETTTLVEAGLGWIVSLDDAKGDFNGRAVLAEQKAKGAPRKLVGFEMVERGIARHGYPVVLDGEAVSAVTSGTLRPLPAEEHRPRLPARGPRGGGHGARDRHPRPPHRGARGGDAVLQASALTRGGAMYPQDCRYSKDHEWIKVEGDRGRIGITDYAQKQLGDVVFLELPEVGALAEGGRAVRDRRVGQGGLGALLPGGRRGRRGERRRSPTSPRRSTRTPTARPG